MSFDAKEFRRCLGNFATGVTVITAQTADGKKVGMTANSFNSVSLEPPLILWSIIKESSSYPVFEQASHFAVNILAADQIDLSNHFARPSDDKFADVEYREGVGKALLLPRTAANFQCENHQILDGGDHWIMIGKVVDFENSGRSPLLYVQGSYAGALPFTGTQSATPVASAETLTRLHDSPIYLMTKVLQIIQESYLPKQSSTGLNSSEARILLVLSDTQNTTVDDLKHLVTIPAPDVDASIDRLLSSGLIAQDLSLTDKGEETATRLWQISDQQNQEIFKDFDEDVVKSFKEQLQALLKQLS